MNRVEPPEQGREPEIDVADLGKLTASERRVLDEVVRGLSTHEVAARLFLTEATVKTHLAHIYDKLGVRGRVDLLAHLKRGVPTTSESRYQHAAQGAGRGRIPAWVYPSMLIALGVLVLVSSAVLALSPGGKHLTFDELASQIDDGLISRVVIEGDAIVATGSGETYVVDASGDQVRQLARDSGVPLVESPAAPVPMVLPLIVSLAPVAVFAGLLWLFWTIRTSTRLDRRD